MVKPRQDREDEKLGGSKLLYSLQEQGRQVCSVKVGIFGEGTELATRESVQAKEDAAAFMKALAKDYAADTFAVEELNAHRNKRLDALNLARGPIMVRPAAAAKPKATPKNNGKPGGTFQPTGQKQGICITWRAKGCCNNGEDC